MNEYHGVIWKPPRFLPPSLPPFFTFIIKAEHTESCRPSRVVKNEEQTQVLPPFLPPSIPPSLPPLPPSLTFEIKTQHTRRCRSSRIIENEGEAHLVVSGGAVDDIVLVPGGVVGAAGLKEGGRKGGRKGKVRRRIMERRLNALSITPGR